MRHSLPVLLIVLVVCAGCVTTDGPATSPTETTSAPVDGPEEKSGETTDTPPSSPPTSSLDLASSGISCNEDLWVSFWGTGDPDLWDQDLVRVGYSVPRNVSFLVVTYVDNSPEGVAYVNNTIGYGVTVDGAELDLDSAFSDEHTVQVVLYHDQNDNGEYEQGVDSPCLVDGEVVRAGPERIDFSEFS